MPTGTIKYLDRGEAWGFISRDDKEPKVFVHRMAAQRAGVTRLCRGQRWRFDLIQRGNSRWEADNLELLSDMT